MQTQLSPPPVKPERFGKLKGALAGTLGALLLAGFGYVATLSEPSWEVGSCVAAANGDAVAGEGDDMIPVRCDEPNEGRIVAEVSSPFDCSFETRFTIENSSVFGLFGTSYYCVE